MAGYSMEKDEYLKRLSRIEGQIRGLQKMVESDTYCIDVLTQLAAATKALQSVGLGLVDQHLRHCVRDAVRSDEDGGEAKLDEAMSAVERLLRT
ncbi:MAG TPA: metal-sensitive transcriptional regulator [Acidimicrobiales bacterium]|nr:metal-sensitive transcriptional regulator [Acidimicrobiales bacterium]